MAMNPGTGDQAGRPAGLAPRLHTKADPVSADMGRAEAHSEDDTPGADLLELHHTAGNAAVSSVLGRGGPGDSVRSVISEPGRALDGSTSSFIRSTTGHDPSGIRLHEGEAADVAARSVDAEMFATGPHLVAPKGLDVTTREGAFKTVHEVHHIMSQQSKGPVDGTETPDGLKISDPSDRFEQEADQVAAAAVERHFDS